MVGKTSEQLESSRSVSLGDKKKIQEEIAPYLLLHHNYAAKPIDDVKKPYEKHRSRSNVKRKNNNNYNKRKLKEILPKTEEKRIVLPLNNINIESDENDSENFITIIVQDDDMDTNEIVIDESTLDIENDNLLNPNSKYCPSISSSDCGYESFDSPTSFNDNDSNDIWDASVGELFPSLL